MLRMYVMICMYLCCLYVRMALCSLVVFAFIYMCVYVCYLCVYVRYVRMLCKQVMHVCFGCMPGIDICAYVVSARYVSDVYVFAMCVRYVCMCVCMYVTCVWCVCVYVCYVCVHAMNGCTVCMVCSVC